MATSIKCEAPGCDVTIEDNSEAVAIARFNSHLMHHTAAHGPAQAQAQHGAAKQRAPRMDRPKIAQDSSEETWTNFSRRWTLFKQCTTLMPDEITGQLFLCCEEELGNHLLKIDPTAINGTEDVLMTAIKRLAVTPVAISVRRAELLQMRQSHGEGVRPFYAKVMGKANTCAYMVRCTCDPSTDVDFTDIIVRDVVVAGLADVEIRKEILGIPNLDTTSVLDVIANIEGKEMARNALTGNASAASISGFKKQRNATPQPLTAKKSAKCPNCSNHFDLFTEGARGWNSKPHKLCIDCWKKSRFRQRPSGTDGKDPQPNLTGSLVLQLAANTATRGRQQMGPVQLNHHIFTQEGWVAAKSLAHPTVYLRMSTRKEDYDALGTTPAEMAPIHLQVITDTGAQSCLWSRRGFQNSGIQLDNLIPVSYGMVAANKTNIRIDGAIIVRLEGLDKGGQSRECASLVYISPDADAFYLSREAMAQLGIISMDFPQIGSAFNSSISHDQKGNDSHPQPPVENCGCPERRLPPGAPAVLPFPCIPENIERMKAWILDRYSSSTFNTCPHQGLPGMDGPPIKIHIDPDATPVAAYTPATIPIHWQDQVKKDLLRDEALGVIERVPHGEPTKWCHRMVITRKHDGGPRRTVDLSPLNKHCLRETHGAKSPFQLARAVPPQSWKTVTDAWNGYHSVPIRDEDRHFTTFITPFGRYRYIRAPQGYLSSGDGYNRRFDEILIEFARHQRCVDDTLHHDLDLAVHWWRTIEFLELVGNAGIILNPGKFQFSQQMVDFAGFRISDSSVEPLPKYIDAIRNFPTPTSITDVRSWFGLVNQVSHYAQLREAMTPFKPLLSHKAQFSWTNDLDTAFNESKNHIIEAIRNGVEIFDINRRTCLRTDWSTTGIGYYLSQQHCSCTTYSPGCCEDGWRITLAGSRFLTSAEKRYAAVEGEMLSVAWGLEQTKYFTQGCGNLLVVTDHKPLVKLLGDRTLDEIANTRLFRLKQRTLMWSFDIQHQPGTENHVADATSRHPTAAVSLYAELASIGMQTQADDAETSMIAEIRRDVNGLMAVTWQRVQDETRRDGTMSQLATMVELGFPKDKTDLPPSLSPFWEFRNSLYIADGVILYKDRAVIPPTLRNEVLQLLHAAHQGVSAMTARAQTTVFWPGISSQIQAIRNECQSCNRNAPSQARMPPVEPHIPNTPFEAVFADYFEFHGWHYLILGDRLSGWTTVYRTPTGTAQSGAKGLAACLRYLFMTYGVPEELSSDGGPEFTARAIQEFLHRWGVRHRLSSAYFAQSNGRAELAVKATKRLLEENVGPNGDLDTDAFVMAMLALRNTPDQDCKLSPAQILFGHPLRDAMPMISNATQKFDNKQFRSLWRDAWASKEDALRTRYTRTYENLKEHSRQLLPLQQGDRVFVQNQTGNYPTKWDRSGTVMECRDNDQHIVKVDGTGRLTLRNRRFLRKFEPHNLSVYAPTAIPAAPDMALTGDPVSPRPVSSTPPTSTPITTGFQHQHMDTPIITPTPTPMAAVPVPPSSCPTHVPPQPITTSGSPPAPPAPTTPPPPSPRRSSRSRVQRRVYDAESGTYVDPHL